MASINYATREISCKIVYYGPGLSGKTTNLQIIHRKIPDKDKSEMVSLATETDRTLFFDFLPLDLGSIKGFSTKFQLYTVPGQVYYNATRKLVLRGVDGVVFVVDSQADKLQENLESFANLQENLREYGHSIEAIPVVLQYNKRDLPNVYSVDQINSLFNKHGLPFYEAVAATGVGVFTTLKAIGKLVIDRFNAKYAGFQGGGRRMQPGQTMQAPARPAAPPQPEARPAPGPFAPPSPPPYPGGPGAPAANPFAGRPAGGPGFPPPRENPFAAAPPSGNAFPPPGAPPSGGSGGPALGHPPFMIPTPFQAPPAGPSAPQYPGMPGGVGAGGGFPGAPAGPGGFPGAGSAPPPPPFPPGPQPFGGAGGSPAGPAFPPPAHGMGAPPPFPGNPGGPGGNPFAAGRPPFPPPAQPPTGGMPAMPAGNPPPGNVPVSPFVESFGGPRQGPGVPPPPPGLQSASPFQPRGPQPMPPGAPPPFGGGPGSSFPPPGGGFGGTPGPFVAPRAPGEEPPPPPPPASATGSGGLRNSFSDNSGIISTYEDVQRDENFKTRKLPLPGEKKKGFFDGLFRKDK